jgi:DNA polymerase-3 subunit epsilon
MQQVKISAALAKDLLPFLTGKGAVLKVREQLQAAIEAAPQYSGKLTALRRLAAACGRPIAAFDIESTTAKAETGRIIEIAVLKVYPTSGGPHGIESVDETWLINPGEPIPADATAVHGFDDASVAEAPHFGDVAEELADFLEGCDILTFNGNKFDVIMLNAHFEPNGIEWPAQGTRLFDASTIYKESVGRTLTDAVSHYLGRDLSGAHGALADTLATVEVFAAQLEADPALAGMTPDELHTHCSYNPKAVDLAGKIELNEQGVPVWTFGKNQGRPVESDPSYCLWVLRSDFTKNTKSHVRRITEGNIF